MLLDAKINRFEVKNVALNARYKDIGKMLEIVFSKKKF